jgi:hypothetical protein
VGGKFGKGMVLLQAGVGAVNGYREGGLKGLGNAARNSLGDVAGVVGKGKFSKALKAGAAANNLYEGVRQGGGAGSVLQNGAGFLTAVGGKRAAKAAKYLNTVNKVYQVKKSYDEGGIESAISTGIGNVNTKRLMKGAKKMLQRKGNWRGNNNAKTFQPSSSRHSFATRNNSGTQGRNAKSYQPTPLRQNSGPRSSTSGAGKTYPASYPKSTSWARKTFASSKYPKTNIAGKRLNLVPVNAAKTNARTNRVPSLKSSRMPRTSKAGQRERQRSYAIPVFPGKRNTPNNRSPMPKAKNYPKPQPQIAKAIKSFGKSARTVNPPRNTRYAKSRR